MSMPRRLSDILASSDRDRLERTWNETTAAEELRPIPSGDFRCLVSKAEFFQAKSGTPGVKLHLEILDGEHAGRRLWSDHWLSPAALPLTKRDLSRLGITSLSQLEQPLPARFIVRAKVVLRRDDDGTERNQVRSFEVVAVEPIVADPFAPTAEDEDFTFSDADEGGDR